MAVKINRKEDKWLLVHIMVVDGKLQHKFVNEAKTKEKIINRNEPMIIRSI